MGVFPYICPYFFKSKTPTEFLNHMIINRCYLVQIQINLKKLMFGMTKQLSPILLFLITFVKEVIFSVMCVCLSVSRIPQNIDGFQLT